MSRELCGSSKHMSGETKLQLTQNTIKDRLIIPCLAEPNPNPNPINGELYFDTLKISCIYLL